MAFGKKYTVSFGDLSTLGRSFTLDIYKDGYGGSVSSIKGTGSPVILDYKKGDIFTEFVRGSIMEVNLVSETDFEYSEFFTAGLGDYYAELIEDSTTIWTGQNVADIYEEPFLTPPYPSRLKFTCGLGDLKSIRYDNSGTLYTGIATHLTIIQRCLNQITPNKNLVEIINVYEDNTNQSNPVLTQHYFDQIKYRELEGDADVGWNCYDILQDICKFYGARLFQSEGKWYFVREREVEGASSARFFEFNSSGTQVDSGTVDLRKNIKGASALTADKITWRDQVQSLDVSLQYDKLVHEYRYNYAARENNILIRNWKWTPPSKEPQVSESGTPNKPVYWGRSADLVNDHPNEIEVVSLTDAPTSDNPIGNEILKIAEEQNIELSENQTQRLIQITEMFGLFKMKEALLKDATGDYSVKAVQEGSTNTQDDLRVTTNDHLEFKIPCLLHKYVDQPGEDTFSESSFEADFRFKIKIGTYYLSGDESGYAWTTSDSIATVRVPQDKVHSNVNDSYQTQIVQISTPDLPETGLKDLEFQIFQPDYEMVGIEVEGTGFLNNIWLKNVWYGPVVLEYSSGSDRAEPIITSESILQGTKRNRTKTFVLNSGDGPTAVSAGSVRLSSGAISSSWSTFGNAEALSARDIFQLNPAERYLADYRRQYRGDLTGSFYPHHALVTDADNKTCIINGYRWDVKNDRISIEMEVLTQVTGTWDEVGGGSLGGFGVGVERPDGFGNLKIVGDGLLGGPPGGLGGFDVVDSGGGNIITDIEGGSKNPTNSNLLGYAPSGSGNLLSSNLFETGERFGPDYSQNGNTLTSADSTVGTATGNTLGTALDFNGNNSVGRSAITGVDGASAVSMQTSIKADAASGVIADNSNARIRINGSGKPAFAIKTGGSYQEVAGSTTLSTGQWYHIAGTYDGTDLKVYLDGTEDGTTAQAGTLDNASGDYRIGQDSSRSNGFDGAIEGVELRAQTLTAAQVSVLSNQFGGITFTMLNNHPFAPGDLIGYKHDTKGVDMIVTQDVGNKQFRAFPASTAYGNKGMTVIRLGNAFNPARDKVAKAKIVNNRPVYFWKTVNTFAEYDDDTNFNVKIDNSGIFVSSNETSVSQAVGSVNADGSSLTIPFEHGLNTQDIVSVYLRKNDTFTRVDYDITDNDNIDLKFRVAPSEGEYTALVVADNEGNLSGSNRIGKYRETITGDGSTTSFNIAHFKDTKDILFVQGLKGDVPQNPAFTTVDSDNLQVDFRSAPANGQDIEIIAVMAFPVDPCCDKAKVIEKSVAPDGSKKEFTVTHRAADQYPAEVMIFRNGSPERVAWERVNANQVKITFRSAPASGDTINAKILI